MSQALSVAIKLQQQPMIDYLLSLGARLDHINRYAESSLTHVIRISNDPDVLQWMLNQPIKPSVRPCDITESIIQGKHRMLVMLLDYDKQGEQREEQREQQQEQQEKRLPEQQLGVATEEKETGKQQQSSDLRTTTTNNNNNNNNGTSLSLLERLDPTTLRSPLMTAASGGQSGTVVLLLDRGAAPNQESPVGHTALSIASFNGFDDTVRALLLRDPEQCTGSGNADINFESCTGHTPLLQTCISGQANTCRILLLHGADPNLQNKQNETAMTTAARCGHADVVMALMTGGAKINQETRSGRMPLHEGLRCNHSEVVTVLLLDAGIGLNAIPQRCEEPRTPLMTAVQFGSVQALEALLTKVVPKDINQIGVDLHFETTKNQTALDVAIVYGQSETALVVIEAMVLYTTYLSEQEGVEYNQKILITRMLLSKLLRYQKKSKKAATLFTQQKKTAEICQNAQAVSPSEQMQRGLYECMCVGLVLQRM